MTTVLPVIPKCFCLRKLCKAYNSSLDKLLIILLLLKLSKEENVVSEIFDLTALVWGIDKSVLLILRKKSSKGNIKYAYSSLLGGIVNAKFT